MIQGNVIIAPHTYMFLTTSVLPGSRMVCFSAKYTCVVFRYLFISLWRMFPQCLKIPEV